MVAASSRAMQERWRKKMAASNTNMTDRQRERGTHTEVRFSTLQQQHSEPTLFRGCVCVQQV